MLFAKFEVNSISNSFIIVASFLAIKDYISRFDFESFTFMKDISTTIKEMKNANAFVKKIANFQKYLKSLILTVFVIVVVAVAIVNDMTFVVDDVTSTTLLISFAFDFQIVVSSIIIYSVNSIILNNFVSFVFDFFIAFEKFFAIFSVSNIVMSNDVTIH